MIQFTQEKITIRLKNYHIKYRHNIVLVTIQQIHIKTIKKQTKMNTVVFQFQVTEHIHIKQKKNISKKVSMHQLEIK